MTEQERSNKFRADMENALHQNRSLTMIAQTIWELAKAYADARESKEIAELKADNKRWCSDFYKIKFELETAEAEIKRLRGALMWLKVNRTPDRAMIEVFIDKALSPAPVTETLNEDQE